ncbi:hypothetical protein LY78DRAFT_426546 [Colletotrichum sublineola]|nr:hypothetical protein LY78DRAFT_426546 [Colletotrichum sublineola]
MWRNNNRGALFLEKAIGPEQAIRDMTGRYSINLAEDIVENHHVTSGIDSPRKRLNTKVKKSVGQCRATAERKTARLLTMHCFWPPLAFTTWLPTRVKWPFSNPCKSASSAHTDTTVSYRFRLEDGFPRMCCRTMPFSSKEVREQYAVSSLSYSSSATGSAIRDVQIKLPRIALKKDDLPLPTGPTTAVTAPSWMPTARP